MPQLLVFESIATLKKWSFSDRCAYMIMASPDTCQTKLCRISGPATDTDCTELYNLYKAELVKHWDSQPERSDPSTLFHRASLNPGERISDYAERLKNILSRCHDVYTHKGTEKLLADKILQTLPKQHSGMSAILEDLPIDTLILKVEKLNLSPGDNQVSMIRRDHTKAQANTSVPRPPPYRKFPDNDGRCTKCGGRNHVSHECLGNATCWYCLKKGHTKFKCPKLSGRQGYNFNRRGKTHAIQENKIDDISNSDNTVYSDSDYIMSNTYISNRPPNAKQINAIVTTPKGSLVHALVDTGSVRSIVRVDKVPEFKHTRSPISLSCANGEPIIIVGKVKLTIDINHHVYSHEFLVSSNLSIPAVIGMDFLCLHNFDINTHHCVIKPLKKGNVCQVVDSPIEKSNTDHIFNVDTNLSSAKRNAMLSVLQLHKFSFSSHKGDYGKSNITTHRIDTGDRPPTAAPCYRIPKALEDEAMTQIHHMLEQGIIRPSHSPWRSPVTMPLKSDGTRRFCVDYRMLNSVTKRDQYPLPSIDSILDRLAGHSYFSKIDLKSAFWQVRIHPDDFE
ncbi:Retrovirus-related Pol polyprotein from transposon 17.6 [Thelohanellus kitauei]|uniref:Retrovirus-related Pol polyprotein from transposon 17.6 n=1 Tax=Thelohanellus kitauei TaxID=669202 RepID=A0A0C2IAY0_THEKT|nr:Retrovirus-related Pol polyprotein from transposon 17.6 [Thelohanellus kitauei]KII62528.1 Retrovirus-related Pol polyprotein from transposon 17.6 [Thelohanellus kitauei]